MKSTHTPEIAALLNSRQGLATYHERRMNAWQYRKESAQTFAAERQCDDHICFHRIRLNLHEKAYYAILKFYDR